MSGQASNIQHPMKEQKTENEPLTPALSRPTGEGESFTVSLAMADICDLPNGLSQYRKQPIAVPSPILMGPSPAGVGEGGPRPDEGGVAKIQHCGEGQGEGRFCKSMTIAMRRFDNVE
jgi:hypothetical protein